MINLKKHISLFCLQLLVTCLTIGQNALPAKKENTGNTQTIKKYKIMIIPFEPKMYMSEIDHKINQATQFNQKQIKWAFRKGLSDQIAFLLKQKFDVINLLSDTVKYKKELSQIYNFITYRYDKIPDPVNYKAPIAEKNEKGIIKGQVNNTSQSTDDHFMNTQVLNPNLIPGLFAKYKSDVFLFINQIEILSGQKELGVTSPVSQNRTINIHYTVYTVDAREIHSGLIKTGFPMNCNIPNQIIGQYAIKTSTELKVRIEKALRVSKSDQK